MVFTALSWIYVAILTYVFGHLAIAIFHAIHQPTQPQSFPLTLLIWIGLVSISGANSYLYIVTNIGLVANLIILSIAAVYGVIQRRSLFSSLKNQWLELSNSYKKQPAISLGLSIGIAGFAVLLIFRSAIAVFYTDTSIYHLQYIEWATRYPAVPGLGNFFHRLAFNSQWILLNTLFSFSFLVDSPLLTLNGFILLVALILSLSSLIRLANQRIQFLTLFRCLWFFPLTYFIFNSDVPTASSPSTDLPTAIAIFIILACIIQYLDDQKNDQDTRVLASLINLFIGFAITVRVTAIPIGLFALYSCYQESRRTGIKTSCISVLPLAFVTLPWLITNVILSGYLLVPLTGFDLFNPDWKVPARIYIFEQENIIAWVRGFPLKIAEMKQLGTFGWVPTWFKMFQLTAEYCYLMGSTIAFLAAFCCYGKSIIRLLKVYRLAYGITAIGILVWFVTTPEPRYAYGFIWGWILLIATATLFPLFESLSHQQKIFKIGLLTLSIATLTVTFNYQIQTVALYLQHQTEAAYSVFSLKGGLVTGGDRYRYHYQANSFWLAPMKFPEFPVQPIAIAGHTIYITPNDSDLCGRAFPCSPYWNYLELPKTLELRGMSLKDGFRMVNPAKGKP